MGHGSQRLVRVLCLSGVRTTESRLTRAIVCFPMPQSECVGGMHGPGFPPAALHVTLVKD